MLYEALIPAYKRERYQTGLMSYGKDSGKVDAAATPGTTEMLWRYGLLLMILNLAMAWADYYIQLSSGFDADSNDPFVTYAYYRLALLVVLRGALFAAASLHVQLRSAISVEPPEHATSTEWPTPSPPILSVLAAFANRLTSLSSNPKFVLRLATGIVMAGATIGSAFFTYMVVYNQADATFGFILAPSLISPGSTWDRCYNQGPFSDGCAGLSYHATEEEFQSFSHNGRAFHALQNTFSQWWQLTYARYYF
jgi:hypothetical protein